MAVSGGVYPMDHAMGYSGESFFFICLVQCFAIGGYSTHLQFPTAGLSPIIFGHSIAGAQAGEPGEPSEPGELGQAWGDLRDSPVLATHEAIQS